MTTEACFVQSLHSAVSNLFNTMIPLDFKAPTDWAPLEAVKEFDRELMGTIDIHGDMCGAISMVLSYSLAIHMTSLFLRETLNEVNEEVYETVAEMLNIIAGGIKTFLAQQGKTFSLGLPQVFDLGSHMDYIFPQAVQGQRSLLVPIHTAQGSFCIALWLLEEVLPCV